jgi:hypothetical protein
VPKLKQFKDRAAETLSTLKVVEPIKNAVVKSLLQDDTLKQRLVSLLPSQEGFDPQAAAEEALRIVISKIRETLSDEPSAERGDYVRGLVTDLMADNVLKSLIR